MKTSLGDDCIFIHLDYDAVKEVVQNSLIVNMIMKRER